MSPPIFNPDGTEVSEIVLPDGSTASEVIGPDGNVVFEAGPDIPDSVVDNFEDADSDPAGVYESGESLTDYWAGDTAEYDRNTNSPVADGSKSIKDNGTQETLHVITSTDGDGLNSYPSEGSIYQWMCYVSSTSGWTNFGVDFGPMGGSFYRVEVDNDSQLHLFKDQRSTGAGTGLDSTSTSIPTGTLFKMEFEWGSGGSLTGRIYDGAGNVQDTVSATDDSYSGGGVGVSTRQQGETIMIDAIKEV